MRKQKIIQKRKLARLEEFPDDLEGRMNAVLNVINTENKMVTMLVLNETPKTSIDLRENFLEMTNEKWRLQSASFLNYFRLILVPIGMVAEEEPTYFGRQNRIRTWTLSATGEKYGQPAAAYFLKKAVDENSSMYCILGSTNSKGSTRSPYNRVKILFTLEKKEKCRIVDLEREINLHSAAGLLSHLTVMKKEGILDYESVSGEEPGSVSYCWIPGKNPENFKSKKSQNRMYERDIAKMLSVLERANRLEIYEQLKNKYIKINEQSALLYISGALSMLVNQDFATSQFKGGERMSEVRLLEKGKRWAKEFHLLEDFLTDQPSGEKINEVHKNLITNPDLLRQYAEYAVSKYKDVSPTYNKKSAETRVKEAYELVSRNPEGIRYKELYAYKRSLPFLIENGYIEKKETKSKGSGKHGTPVLYVSTGKPLPANFEYERNKTK